MLLRSFIRLNDKKIKGSFIIGAVAFLVLFGIVFIVADKKREIQPVWEILGMLLVFGLGLPLFCIAIGYFDWALKTSVRNKIYRTMPFSDLVGLNFKDDYINETSRFLFTEEVKSTSINGFYIKCDVNRKSKNIVDFTALVEYDPKSIHRNYQLRKELKGQGIRIGMREVSKEYDWRKSTISSVQELKHQLEEFTELLRKEGFKPAVSGNK